MGIRNFPQGLTGATQILNWDLKIRNIEGLTKKRAFLTMMSCVGDDHRKSRDPAFPAIFVSMSTSCAITLS